MIFGLCLKLPGQWCLERERCSLVACLFFCLTGQIFFGYDVSYGVKKDRFSIGRGAKSKR